MPPFIVFVDHGYFLIFPYVRKKIVINVILSLWVSMSSNLARDAIQGWFAYEK